MPTDEGTDRPNVVFCLADDLGWMDTAHYGSEFYDTPNIDRLAARGMTFTEAYAANPLCSPTRASIMTGQNPARIGITSPAGHREIERFEQTLEAEAPPDRKVRNANSVTRLSHDHESLATAFSEAGYATAHFGKWHLGHEPYDALNHGFDVSKPNAPVPGPIGGYHAPWEFWPDHGDPGQNIEDKMAEEAVGFIEEQAADESPFFLNYWHFSVHTPVDGDIELVEKYIRKVDPTDSQHHPVYAAMVEKLDTAVGRLLDALEEQGVRDETIVVFFSDNGGVNWPEGGGEIPLTSNAPLRAGKASVYEGGTREPLIVSWPGEIEAGSESDALVSSMDFYPTLVDLCGMDRRPDQHVDGESFAPALDGGEAPRDHVFLHFPHTVIVHEDESAAATVRRGDWKLLRFFHAGPEFEHRHELYHLANDPGERRNLADDYPELVAELDELIEDRLQDIDAVIPKPNPNYDPAADDSPSR